MHISEKEILSFPSIWPDKFTLYEKATLDFGKKSVKELQV